MGRKRELELTFDATQLQADPGKLQLDSAVNPPDGARASIPAGAAVEYASYTVSETFDETDAADTLTVDLVDAEGAFVSSLIAVEDIADLNAGVHIVGAGDAVAGPAQAEPLYLAVTMVVTDSLNTSIESGAFTTALSAAPDEAFYLALTGPTGEIVLFDEVHVGTPIEIDAADIDAAIALISPTEGYTFTGSAATDDLVVQRADGQPFTITFTSDFDAPGVFASDPGFTNVEFDEGNVAYPGLEAGKLTVRVGYSVASPSQTEPGFVIGEI
jgi:hypothetical protein